MQTTAGEKDTNIGYYMVVQSQTRTFLMISIFPHIFLNAFCTRVSRHSRHLPLHVRVYRHVRNLYGRFCEVIIVLGCPTPGFRAVWQVRILEDLEDRDARLGN